MEVSPGAVDRGFRGVSGELGRGPVLLFALWDCGYSPLVWAMMSYSMLELRLSPVLVVVSSSVAPPWFINEFRRDPRGEGGTIVDAGESSSSSS